MTTHKKGAEEDERHKVCVGQVGAAGLVEVILEGLHIARLTLDARQHYALPRFPRSTPAGTHLWLYWDNQ